MSSATVAPSLTASDRLRLAAGATSADLVRGYVEDARDSLIDAMKLADRLGATEEHRQVGERVLALDDLLAFLRERSGR